METLRNDAHTSETIYPTLSCVNTHHIDELTKEKEDELLYGTGEDGDEEEALSDDSMRLRLSDDEEAETEDALLRSPLGDRKLKPEENRTESTPAENTDAQPSFGPDKVVTDSVTTKSELKQEELCSGNISTDDKLVTDHQRKDMKMSGNGLRESQIANKNHCPWPSYESRWRFPSSPRIRSFHCINRPSYPRHHFPVPNEHYRHDSYQYYNRFNNAYQPFKRARGTGKCAYYKQLYGDRMGKKFQSKTVLPQTASTKTQTSSPPTDTTAAIQRELQSNTNNAQETEVDVKNEQNDSLDEEYLSNNETDNYSIAESEINVVKTEMFNDQNVESSNADTESNTLETDSKADIVKINDDDSEVKLTSNDVDVNDPIPNVNCTVNGICKTEIVNPPIDSHDENKEIESKRPIRVCDVDSGICDFDSSENSVEMETSLIKTEDIESKAEKQRISMFVDEANASNDKENEKTARPTVLPTEMSKEPEGTCQSISQNCSEEMVDSGKPNDTVARNITSQDPKEDNSEKSCEDDSAATSNNVEKMGIADDALDEVKETSEDADVSSVQNDKSDDDVEICANVCDVSKADDTVLDKLEDKKKCLRDDKDVNASQATSDVETKISKNVDCEKKRRLSETENSTSPTVISTTSSSEGGLQDESEGDGEHDVKIVDDESVKVVNSVSKQPEHAGKTAVTLEGSNLCSEQPILEDLNNEDNVNKNSDCTKKNSLSSSGASLGLDPGTKSNKDDSEKKDAEVPVTTQRRRRRTKKMIAAAQEAAYEEEKQVRESGRQRRRTAKNAEEIIRKKFLNHDSDLESSDGSEKFVIVNHKVNQTARSSSPPSLKRNCPDVEITTANGTVKRVKTNPNEVQSNEATSKEGEMKDIKNLNFVHKFFQRDIKDKLPKLKQEELEELLIQKIVETITMRGEIGRLREQARISEKNQEATRARCQQLAKQIKDFEMVLSRNAADRRANNDKPIPPIKINRSVGLQVSFMTDHGMQNLRQLQQSTNVKPINMTNGSSSSNSETNNNVQSPRRGIKIRSPRRSEVATGVQPTIVSQSHGQNPSIIPAVTPAALVVAKSIESQHNLALANQPNNVQQILPNVQPQQPQPIVSNGKVSNPITRQGTQLNISKPRPNDLIDLTDEEEKSKGNTVPTITTTINDQQISIAQKPQTCFQRVIQTIPGNVAITTQPTSIRVVQPASQPTPTALVNNMNAPRLAYVMQSGVGSTRQLLITSNSSQIRPVTTCNRPTFPTLTYKTGISTVANGTVRVLTTPATANVQVSKHPAPLPDTPNYNLSPMWKLPPPAPSLKISKVANGIVLSWNMTLSDKYADIASYQLYAYQEVPGIPPSTALWKKVGDVRALPLPMACTLTQFSEGNNYYFAVRAVDTHSRKGQYSIPGNISL